MDRKMGPGITTVDLTMTVNDLTEAVPCKDPRHDHEIQSEDNDRVVMNCPVTGRIWAKET